MTSQDIRDILDESDTEDPFAADTDDNDYIPGVALEESDRESQLHIEEESESDSDESIDDDPPQINHEVLKGKDGTPWNSTPFPQHQTSSRNILRQSGGTANFTKNLNEKETFKSIMSPEICNIILRETNRKASKIVQDYNNQLVQKYPVTSQRPPEKKYVPFVDYELDAFFGILIILGVHRSNKEFLHDLWKTDAIPLVRASMPRERFKFLLRCIRFDNDNTREERAQSDKAAPIRDIWIMLNANLQKCYQPKQCITVDEQLFPFRGRTKFTQYIPSKPSKYGIKVFWACDASNAYPLQGQMYTGKPVGGDRQINVGEKIVLELVKRYKNSGRNVTTDNFFTSLNLQRALNSWNMTLVGTLRRNKRFLPPTMQPSKDRALLSTNFAFRDDVTICSYVPKKKKSVILLSSMHMLPVVDETPKAKPEIINYYNHTKGGVDTMDKLLTEYTVKRRTNRWPLAFFYNMIDVSALAAKIIFVENNVVYNVSGQRRLFLKKLAKQLCNAAIDSRISDAHQMKIPSIRTAIEMVLDCQITVAPESVCDSTGRKPFVGSCYVCRNLNKKQRKTRKACVTCARPICDEHCHNNPKCSNCNI